MTVTRTAQPRLHTALALALSATLALAGCGPLESLPPATGAAPCPPRAAEGVVAAIDPADLEGSILAALNAGASPQAVAAAVRAHGLGAAAGLPFAEADLDGDGVPEAVVAIVDPSSDPIPAAGALLVLTCRAGAYTPLARVEGQAGAPILHAAIDLNLDGEADLLVAYPSCGAHTCFERIEAYLWDGAALAGRLTGDSSDLPFPEVAIEAAGPDGFPLIAVTGTAVGSAGAGPYRPRTRTWAWSPAEQAFVPTGETLHPARQRIHLLHDADDAARAGDLTAALDLYRRVLADDSLEDRSPDDRAALAAYAGFRLMRVHAQRGEPQEVEAAYAALLAGAPPESAGRGFAELAAAFLEAYWATGEIRQGCAAAGTYAETYAERVLLPLDYGYANRSYTAADLCPIGP